MQHTEFDFFVFAEKVDGRSSCKGQLKAGHRVGRAGCVCQRLWCEVVRHHCSAVHTCTSDHAASNPKTMLWEVSVF